MNSQGLKGLGIRKANQRSRMMHLLKFCIDPFPARCFWCSAVVNTEVTLLVTIRSHLGPGNETISFPDSALPLSSGMKYGNEIAIILAISTRASHFT